MKVIAIYARKSLFTGKGDSIGAQIDTCKRFIDYKFAHEEYELKIFQDEGWSGKTTDRPEFTKLLKAVKNKEINYVITYKLDRLGRTARDLHNFLYDIDKLNIVYLSATEPYDTTTSAGRFMISILAAMAQMERERLAERVKSGMVQLAKKGRWLGGQCPLGFDSKKEMYIDDLGKERQLIKLTANKEEIKIIKLLYKKYLELGSLTQLRKYCVDNSLKGKNGGDFSSTTLNQILTSPIYVKSTPKIMEYLEQQDINAYGEANGNGIITFNKTKEMRIERTKSEWIAAVSSHKGIIDDDIWLQVQDIINKQSEKQKESSGRQGTSNRALLSGLIKCSKCGSNMLIKTGHKSKKNPGHVYSYYVCNSKADSYGLKTTKCTNSNLRVDETDKAIIEQIKAYNKDMLIKELESISTEANKVDIESENKVDSIQNKISEKEKAINNLVKKLSLLEDESISKILLDQISNLNKEIGNLKKQLDDVTLNLIETSKFQLDLKSYIRNLENFNKNIDIIDDLNMQKDLLGSIIEKIEWDGETGELKVIPLVKKK